MAKPPVACIHPCSVNTPTLLRATTYACIMIIFSHLTPSWRAHWKLRLRLPREAWRQYFRHPGACSRQRSTSPIHGLAWRSHWKSLRHFQYFRHPWQSHAATRYLRSGRRRLLGCILLLFLALGFHGATASTPIEVVVEGVEEPLRTNVFLFLSVEQQKNLPEMAETRIRLLHARAPGEIRAALQPFGYYQPHIDSTLIQDETHWIATYVIALGEPVRIGEMDVRIEGDAAADTEFQKRVADLPLRKGAIFNHAVYERSKRALQNLGAQRGYFDAELQRNEVQVKLETNSASVFLYYHSGRRYRFGSLAFIQDRGLNLDLLQRYVPFQPGAPYDTADLLKMQGALNDSDYFQKVDVQPRRDSIDDLAVPIDVTLVLRDRDKYTVGAGYGTDTGARGKLGWERRMVGPSGNRYSVDLSGSQINTSITAGYRIPVNNPHPDEIVLSGGWTDDHPETSDSQTRLLGVSLNKLRGEWRQGYSLNYRHERFVTGTDNGVSTLYIPEANWQRIHADNRVVTRWGHRIQLVVRGASTNTGSDVTFFQARANAKLILPVLTDGRLLSRIDSGYTQVRDFENLPASQRFYTGGDQSVRGYNYNSLGPVDGLGKVIGGKRLLVGSIEYEHRLLEKWSAAVFYDAGNAYNDRGEKFKEGAGVGVRWKSPIGPVRLDVAWALSTEERPWRIHLVVGPDL